MKTLIEKIREQISPDDMGQGCESKYVNLTFDETGQVVSKKFSYPTVFPVRVTVESVDSKKQFDFLWTKIEDLLFRETWCSPELEKTVQADEPFLPQAGDEITLDFSDGVRTYTVESFSFADEQKTVVQIDAQYTVTNPFQDDLYEEMFDIF